MDSDDLLGLIRQTVREEMADSSFSIGTVDTVDGTSASVRFDGETSASVKKYPTVGYTPVAGDRVVLSLVGRSWVILGKVSSGAAGGSHPDSDHTFYYDPPSPTTPLSDYPDGLSVGTVLSSDGWPVTGTLTTVNRSSIRCVQYLTEFDGDAHFYRTHHSNHPDWGSWLEVPVVGNDETITGAWSFRTGELDLPQAKGANGLASDPASDYPIGLSFSVGSGADGWPTNAIIITFRYSAGRTMQIATQHRTGNTETYIRNSNSDDTWTAWAQIAYV